MNMMRLSKFRTEKASGSFPREFYQRNKFLCRRRLFLQSNIGICILKKLEREKTATHFSRTHSPTDHSS